MYQFCKKKNCENCQINYQFFVPVNHTYTHTYKTVHFIVGLQLYLDNSGPFQIFPSLIFSYCASLVLSFVYKKGITFQDAKFSVLIICATSIWILSGVLLLQSSKIQIQTSKQTIWHTAQVASNSVSDQRESVFAQISDF